MQNIDVQLRCGVDDTNATIQKFTNHISQLFDGNKTVPPPVCHTLKHLKLGLKCFLRQNVSESMRNTTIVQRLAKMWLQMTFLSPFGPLEEECACCKLLQPFILSLTSVKHLSLHAKFDRKSAFLFRRSFDFLFQ